jgi:hypothetical protein
MAALDATLVANLRGCLCDSQDEVSSQQYLVNNNFLIMINSKDDDADDDLRTCLPIARY